jgi:hypothetical protein
MNKYGVWNVDADDWVTDEDYKRLEYLTIEDAENAIETEIFNPRHRTLEVKQI